MGVVGGLVIGEASGCCVNMMAAPKESAAAAADLGNRGIEGRKRQIAGFGCRTRIGVETSFV